MAPPKKYATEQERYRAIRRQQNNYGRKRQECQICHQIFTLGNKTIHLKSRWHLKVLSEEELSKAE